MHTSASFANGESNLRSDCDCHVNASTINRRILITDIVIDWVPLLLETVSDVKIVLCDRSRSLNIFNMTRME